MRDIMADMASAAFDNFEDTYDPSETYDPAEYDGDNFGTIKQGAGTAVIGTRKAPKRAAPATFNVFVNGSTNTQDHIFELFNNEFSITKYANGQTNPGLKTLGAAYGTELKASNGTTNYDFRAYGAVSTDITGGYPGSGVNDLVYWNEAGNLVYNYSVGSVDNIIISCKEVPYRALFDYTASGVMRIQKMRILYTQAAQIQEDFTLTYRNILGVTKTNSLSPKQFFTPQQFQSLLVDVPTPFQISKERGMFMKLLAAPLGGTTSVSITFFVDQLTQPNL